MESGTPSKERQAEMSSNYRIQVHDTVLSIAEEAWDALCQRQDAPTPFMQHRYLAALHSSASAIPDTGWSPRFVTLWQQDHLVAACPLYLKDHSYGEYVFDWAWAQAYHEHGLAYYPKALVGVPFTPVPGSRLLALDAASRKALLEAVLALCRTWQVSSLHVLFTSPADRAACDALGLMQRETVQFHWHNHGYANFDDFLGRLSQDKRKKIRQERRRVAEAGVRFRTAVGSQITDADWAFFYRCYERTYLEHGNAPYLQKSFFRQMQQHMPQHWVMFIAEREQQAIACSLIAVQGLGTSQAVAYGRYWGALERVDCLHFEACYYQPLSWCIAQGVQCFEGGAQGEHKMARALMPVTTLSAHWLDHPAFADAVNRFLSRERAGVDDYLAHLAEHSPFKPASPSQ